MNRKTIFLSAALAMLLTGCRSDKTAAPKEYVSIPMFMAGQEIPADSQEKYLYNAQIKMYSIGRTVDPVTGTMREAGTVYRVEQGPEWNLIPQYDADHEAFWKLQHQKEYGNVLAGQISASSKQTKAVLDQVEQLRKNNADLSQTCTELRKSNEKLMQELTKRDEAMTRMTNNMKLLTDYVERLEKRIAQTQKQKSVPPVIPPARLEEVKK